MAALALAALLPAGRSAVAEAPSAGTLLSDGTRVEHWKLSNGLRVVTRNVPGAPTCAVTLAYRLGSREDPVGQEGRAEFAGQIAFTARAGDVPQRSMAEVDQLRPSGWSVKVTPYITEMTEASPKEQMPGVLHQVCQRLRGVVVTDALVDGQREEVRERLRRSYDESVNGALYLLSEQISFGRTSDRAMRQSTGEGIESAKASDLRTLIAERLAPANASLSIAGDLAGLDLHRLLDHELGDVPPGKRAPEVHWGASTSARAVLTRPDLKTPVAVLAILAPPLSDSTHAFFTTFALSAAPYCNAVWGKAEAPLIHRFQYSLAADPEMVRFYPPVPTQSPQPAEALTALLEAAREHMEDSLSMRRSSEIGLWMAGGPLTPELSKRVPTDATVTNSLSTMLAALELYGDEAFWSEYRRRLVLFTKLDPRPMYGYFTDPRRQVSFVLKPEH